MPSGLLVVSSKEGVTASVLQLDISSRAPRPVAGHYALLPFSSALQGFSQPFWEGALGPFALEIFRYLNQNWENFLELFLYDFLKQGP